jgi:DNA-binding transcriptional LysR family regulator
MQNTHHDSRMLVHLRSFLSVVEEGNLHRAAERLRLSQSTVSRQMQALEAELGGQLLERTSTDVRPTNGGHGLAAKAGALLASFEGTIVEVRRLLRGESEQLRIGYVGSAADDYLNPALAKLRQTYPAATEDHSNRPTKE